MNFRIVRLIPGRYVTRLAVATMIAAAAAGVAAAPAGAAVSKWSSVSAGSFHTCGIKTNGTLWCWGLNNAGQLGIGTVSADQPKLVPTQVGTATNWKMVSAGDAVTCGVRTDGTGLCWGDNSFGQLGVGDVVSRAVPAVISDGGSASWATIDVHRTHTCGVKTNGVGKCWGDNFTGALGTGDRGNPPSTNPRVVADNHLWKQIMVGSNFSCGLDTNGIRFCWGSNEGGRLGLGDNMLQIALKPRTMQNDGVWLLLDVDDMGGCGTSAARRLYCWGFEPSSVPAIVSSKWTAMSDSGEFKCGIATTGKRMCMGLNNMGQLGLGHHANLDEMTFLDGDGSYLVITTGRSQGCGISTANRLYCWGENKHGELGDNTRTERTEPVLVS